MQSPIVQLRNKIRTLFQLVRCNDHIRLAKELNSDLGHGLVNATDNVGYSLLHVACLHGHLECAKVLESVRGFYLSIYSQLQSRTGHPLTH